MRWKALSILLLAIAISGRAAGETVQVAAAISLKDALKEIGAAYQADGGGAVEFTFGSSGQMLAQIRNGAPIDAFISAANEQVDTLVHLGLADARTRRVVATGELVLIVPAKGDVSIDSFSDLSKPTVRRIGMGDPRTVPAGHYASEVLDHLKLRAAVADRLLYGADVRQVLTYVEHAEVDAGLVYATDAKLAGARVKVVATAPADAHSPIKYPAILVKGREKAGASKAFLDYMCGKRSQEILVKWGFGLPKPEPQPTTQPANHE